MWELHPWLSSASANEAIRNFQFDLAGADRREVQKKSPPSGAATMLAICASTTATATARTIRPAPCAFWWREALSTRSAGSKVLRRLIVSQAGWRFYVGRRALGNYLWLGNCPRSVLVPPWRSAGWNRSASYSSGKQRHDDGGTTAMYDRLKTESADLTSRYT